MIRRVIASVAIGPHCELLELSMGKLKEFADKHKYEISICTTSLDESRPPPWTKILHILNLMKIYDEILWIDSDAIIVDSSEDITSSIALDSELSWVLHEYDNELHPNSGVMYIRVNSNTQKLFQTANMQTDLAEHPWWDQAALMRVLDLESLTWPIGKGSVTEKIDIKIQKLANDWNSIRRDPASKPRIRHFAGEHFWFRKLSMAKYANPYGYSQIVLSFMLKHFFIIEYATSFWRAFRSIWLPSHFSKS